MGQQISKNPSAGGSNRPPVQLMISYAHKDESLRLAFEEHLAVLRRHKLVDVWNDRQIRAGTRWDSAIKDSIDDADIVLLLVSPAFFASNYIDSVELTRALERAKAGKAAVVPIIIREGDYKGAPFSDFKELPTDGLAQGRSVTGKRWKNRDEAFRDVAEGLRREVERLWGRRLEEHTAIACVKKENREPSDEEREEIRGLGATFGRLLDGRRVLWVDDHPENNETEKATLEVVGVNVTTATTTEEGMHALTSGEFDLVISDWERDPRKARNTSEGMRLLREMRAAHIFTPLIFYAGWLTADELAARKLEVAKAGASGQTAAPKELLRWVIGELVRAAAFDHDAPFVETPLYAPDPKVPGPTRATKPMKKAGAGRAG